LVAQLDTQLKPRDKYKNNKLKFGFSTGSESEQEGFMFWFRPDISEGSNWPLFYLWSDKNSSFISVQFSPNKASFYFGSSEPSIILESGEKPWSNDWLNLKCSISHGDQSKIECSILNHKSGASVSKSVELTEVKWPNGDVQGYFEVNSESVQIKDFRYFN
jgi:hypothetical protein